MIKNKKEVDISTYDIGKYKALERAAQGECKSYVLNIAVAALKAKEQATGRVDFIELMKQQGFTTSWSDSRKYITFTDKDGNKARNSNLEKPFKTEFGKEQLENEFKRNSQREEIRTNSEREVTGIEQTKQNGTGKQLTEREFNGVHSIIRGIEDRTKPFSGKGREEIRERQRAEQAERARVAKKQREMAERAEQQRKQIERQQQDALRRDRNNSHYLER